MPKDTPSSSEELFSNAEECLRNHESEVDSIVDSTQTSYRNAQIHILVEYLKFSEAEAKSFLEQREKRISGSSRETEQVKNQSSQILQMSLFPHKDMTEAKPIVQVSEGFNRMLEEITRKLIDAYKDFSEKHSIDINEPIPEKFKEQNIFTFTYQEKEYHISFSIAHLHLKPNSKMNISDFIRSML